MIQQPLPFRLTRSAGDGPRPLNGSTRRETLPTKYRGPGNMKLLFLGWLNALGSLPVVVIIASQCDFSYGER
jgi:hypothetical protein